MGRAMSGSWKVTLPCTRAEAEAIDAAEVDDAVLMTTEEVEDDREHWRLDAYMEREPDAGVLAVLRALVPSAGEAAPAIERLGDEDWVTLSQAGLEPIREGRFVVHTSAYPADAPPGGRAFLIEAGRAFGTGHHATTAGCLAALDGYQAAERTLFTNIVDLGSGTGILAFAAHALWPSARVLATDIDPVAIDVLRANAETNAVPIGEGAGTVTLLVADGADHPAIAARGPFDLLIANILAGPLIAMAPEIASVAAPGATVLLAGLLTSQADAVTAAFEAVGCARSRRADRGDWTILELVGGDQRYVADGPFNLPGRDGWALDL